jgi:polyphosphate kinase 2 (PPK2 family)
MLEKIDLSKKLKKKKYKAQLPKLQRRLYDLETAAWKAAVPSIIIFEGWDAAGKGTTISTLTQRLDPRGFKLYPIRGARTYESMRPWLWRFWLKLPNYGEMAIFDRSWYGRVMVERVEGLTPESEWQKAYRDIMDFEHTIADDGYVLVKFWLHISKDEQLRRFKVLEKNPLKSWQVTEEDWDHHHRYDDYLVAVEEMLERTETEWAPWTIVEATNRWWARSKVFNTIINALSERLAEIGALPEASEEEDEDFDEDAGVGAEDAGLTSAEKDDDGGGDEEDGG